MWRTWFKIFGLRVVITEDKQDRETRIRFARFTEDCVLVRGSFWHSGFKRIILPLDGKGHRYIERWYEI